jgi:CRP-like cAMP-binding protein
MSAGQTHGVAKVVERSWLLQTLPPGERDRLIQRLGRRRYASGQVIFSRGDPGSALLLVAEGRVRISVTSREGREVTLAILRAGELFGEIALLDGKERSADAVALGACVLLALERRDLMDALRRSPDTALRLCAIVCARARATSERLEGAAVLTVEARLARLLLSLAPGHADDGQPPSLDGTLSQSEIARLICSTRQTVNNHLGRWRRQQVLAQDGRLLRIRDPDRLRDIAEL